MTRGNLDLRHPVVAQRYETALALAEMGNSYADIAITLGYANSAVVRTVLCRARKERNRRIRKANIIEFVSRQLAS